MSFASSLKELRIRRKITQQKLAEDLGISASAIGMYEQGRRFPDFETLEAIADYFNVDMNSLLGKETTPLPKNLIPLDKVRYIPLIGKIACGKPIFAEENIIDRILLPTGVHADFALLCQGDSMIGANIDENDIVFIRRQPQVENGEIAAVMIEDEATLKKVYLEDEKLTLMPMNPKYQPFMYVKREMERVRIIGKAVAILKTLE